MKDTIRNGSLIDENHPGWDNLIPKEKKRFKNYRAKEDDDQELRPPEEEDDDNLYDIIRFGRPIDENHPGFDNLNPEQQAKFRQLFSARKRKDLDPEENAHMENLEDIIVNGIPIDEHHPGFKSLDPLEKRQFKKLKALKEDEPLSPNQ